MENTRGELSSWPQWRSTAANLSIFGKRDHLAGNGFVFFYVFSTAHHQRAAFGGGDSGGEQCSRAPFQIDFEAAAGADAADLAFGPRGGQRGEQVELAGVALQQHLAEAGGGPEIAVDLIGRVGD